MSGVDPFSVPLEDPNKTNLVASVSSKVKTKMVFSVDSTSSAWTSTVACHKKTYVINEHTSNDAVLSSDRMT